MPNQRRPGETLAKVLEEFPGRDQGPLVAYLEQKYRQLGDLQTLREIRAYMARMEKS
jgi:hypothetical protein